ncbi:hypothetical protein BDZ89DRAFT_1046138 [Hymenopellis radicata]|nr:hypothetical protein BDZ89DRAFT_1046138 [Hymenopellis radicata]
MPTKWKRQSNSRASVPIFSPEPEREDKEETFLVARNRNGALSRVVHWWRCGVSSESKGGREKTLRELQMFRHIAEMSHRATVPTHQGILPISGFSKPDEKLTIRIPPRLERIIPTRRPMHFVEYDNDESYFVDEGIRHSKVISYADILLRPYPVEYDAQQRFRVLKRILGNDEARSIYRAVNRSDRKDSQHAF